MPPARYAIAPNIPHTQSMRSPTIPHDLPFKMLRFDEERVL
jgi:hypothetical protein